MPTGSRGLRTAVPLRPADGVIVVACAGVCLWLLAPGARWAPGAGRAAAGFALLALGPLLLRLLQALRPRLRLPGRLADFWLLPAAALGHELLDPLADAVGQPLRDPQLALLDLRLLGAHASVGLEHRLAPWLEEALMLCYYGHFVWPVVLGILLYVHADPRRYDRYLLTLALYFTANYTLYLWVPAVGPRFFLAGHFDTSLQGGWLAPRLASLMLYPSFLRDCFPSGHTGVALVVLITAWRDARRLFWVALLPCAGLVASTLYGRFHYAVDLLAAVPVACAVAAGAQALYRRLPQEACASTGARPLPSR